MILAGVLLKLGGFGLLRLMSVYQSVNLGVVPVMCRISLWGGFLCGIICLRQTDMKGLIAYRSITHMGVIVGGVISGSVVGWQGGLLMMVAHGLVSSCIFMGANLAYKIFSSRRMFFIKGLLRVFPVFSLF